jgi:hypothetical protein
VSFPCEYPGEPHSLKLQYKPESENGLVKAPCLGSTNEPDAEPGNLCVTRGSGNPKEATDKSAAFVGFTTAFGEQKKAGETLSAATDLGRVGMLIQFRTTTFEEAAPKTVPAEARLNAKGSWAVRAN